MLWSSPMPALSRSLETLMLPFLLTKCHRSWLSMQLIWDTLSNSPISLVKSRQEALGVMISSPSELRPESGPTPLSTVLLFTSASALLLLRFFSSLSAELPRLNRILLRLSTLETFLRTRGS